MAKKALILDNKVVDVVDTEFDVHSDLTWMDCTDDCVAGMGWTVVSGVLTAPAAQPAVTYSTKRRQKYKALGSQDEMRYDDLVNGTTTWQDAIAAIKAEIPKP